MTEISVVIPCYNEEKNIEKCIQKSFSAFEKLGVEGEVIVVDNNSTDKSSEIAKNSGAKVVFCEQIGYGNALRYGFKAASGKYIIMGDGDDSYDFSEIPEFYLEITTKNADMITGTRLKGTIHKGAMPFLHRYLGTPVLTFILNLLYKTKISDSQCGMRMFKRDCLDKIEFKTTGWNLPQNSLFSLQNTIFQLKKSQSICTLFTTENQNLTLFEMG